MTAGLQVRLASAYEAFRAKRYDSARTHLQGIKHPKAAHLLGMIARSQGRLDEALSHLEWAAREAPSDPEILVSLGRAQFDRSDLEAAEEAFRSALAVGSGAQARLAKVGLARLLLQRGEAEEALRLLPPPSADAPEVALLRGTSLLETGDLAQAADVLRLAYNAAPSVDLLRTLAQVVWLSGDHAGYRELVQQASQRAGFGAFAVEVARSSADIDWAWSIGLGVAADKEDPAAFRTAMATLAIERNDAASALALAGDVVRSNPTYGPAVAAVVSAQLMLGDTEKAEQLIARMRAAEPLGQHWIGYEVVALRQRGHDVSALTTDLVGVYELPVPEGFESLVEFNRAFAQTLTRLHGSTAQPLGQSLRGGTQTHRNLACYRDPVVQAYLAALRAPIAEHLAQLGNSAANPCSARNTGQFNVSECWSVTLGSEGFHAPHVHPEGWLSSAYYVSVPPGSDRQGWLKFGQSPLVLPEPQSVLKWVEPEPGMVALFPSYLWHGTEPVAVGGERLTAPFDVQPVAD